MRDVRFGAIVGAGMPSARSETSVTMEADDATAPPMNRQHHAKLTPRRAAMTAVTNTSASVVPSIPVAETWGSTAAIPSIDEIASSLIGNAEVAVSNSARPPAPPAEWQTVAYRHRTTSNSTGAGGTPDGTSSSTSTPASTPSSPEWSSPAQFRRISNLFPSRPGATPAGRSPLVAAVAADIRSNDQRQPKRPLSRGGVAPPRAAAAVIVPFRRRLSGDLAAAAVQPVRVRQSIASKSGAGQKPEIRQALLRAR